MTLGLQNILTKFASKKLSCWLECMSIMGSLRGAFKRLELSEYPQLGNLPPADKPDAAEPLLDVKHRTAKVISPLYYGCKKQR